jgi:RHS repeat-associated protein
VQPDRQWSLGSYRYGFNGKENDNEVKGEGNQQAYGMRVYDPRLGKFLSVDPLTPKYPELTPYQFASNRPIDGVDLDGLKTYHYTLLKKGDGKPVLTYLGVQANNFAWWQSGDANPVANFTTAKGSKIEEKNIKVRLLDDNFPKTAEEVGRYSENVQFNSFKDLREWQKGRYQLTETELDPEEKAMRQYMMQMIILEAYSEEKQLEDKYYEPFPVFLPEAPGPSPRGTVPFNKRIEPQKQQRHVLGSAPPNKSYLNSVEDAQTVIVSFEIPRSLANEIVKKQFHKGKRRIILTYPKFLMQVNQGVLTVCLRLILTKLDNRRYQGLVSANNHR